MDNLSQLGGKKIQEKIMMRKQLNNYDGVLSKLKGNEEIEFDNKDAQISDSKEKVELKFSENDNTAEDSTYNARWYNLGFLQSKLIKNIICCLSERQQIGGNICYQLILFHQL